MTARFNDRVFSSLRLKMIPCLIKGYAGALLQMAHHLSRKIDMAIEACAHRRSAKRKLAQSFDRFFCAFFGVRNLLGVAGKFLLEPHRRRVHQMCPTYLDDLPYMYL